MGDLTFTAPNNEQSPEPLRRVRVQHPFQVVHEGTVYPPDEIVEVPETVASHWIRDGLVVTDDTGNQEGASKRPTK
jgi:hypothetical protein